MKKWKICLDASALAGKLILEAQRANWDACKFLMLLGAAPTHHLSCDPECLTALDYFARAGKTDFILLGLQAHQYANIYQLCGHAIIKIQVDTLSFLTTFNKNKSAFILRDVAQTKNWPLCLELMQRGIPPMPIIPQQDNYHGTAMFHFIQEQKLDLIAFAMKNFLGIAGNTDLRTALLFLDQADAASITALATAHQNNQPYIARLLLSAAEQKKWDICRILIEKNAEFDYVIQTGEHIDYQTMHFFAENGQSDLITLALKRGALLPILKNKNKTPIALAVDSSHWESILIMNALFPLEKSSNAIMLEYDYALTRAALAGELDFCARFIKQNPNAYFPLEELPAFIIAIATDNYRAAEQLILNSPFSLSVLTDDLLFLDKIKQFFSNHCDFHAIDFALPPTLATELLSCDLPLEKLNNTTRTLLSQSTLDQLSARAVYHLLLQEIPLAVLENNRPPAPETVITAERFKTLGNYSNTQFIEFMRWIETLLIYTAKNHLPELRKKLQNHYNAFYEVLMRFIDSAYVSALYQTLKNPAGISITVFQEKRESIKKALINFYENFFTRFNQTSVDRLASLIKSALFSLPLESTEFQISCYFACFLARINYPRNLFLGEGSESIGALMSKLEDHDFDDLIFIGKSFNYATVLVVEEFVSEFLVSHLFRDPTNHKAFDDKTVEQLLGHPKIRDAVLQAHHDALVHNNSLKQTLQIIEAVAAKLRSLGNTLYAASTDSGRPTFDANTANTAVEDFLAYSERLPAHIKTALNNPALHFYINARR